MRTPTERDTGRAAETTSPPAPTWLYFLLAGLGLAGTLLVLAATSRYGIGLAPDSANYLSAARSLAHGAGFLRFDGQQYSAWPPLLPLLLAVLEAAGVGARAGIRMLHALAFGAVVFLGGETLTRVVRSRVLAVIGALLILVAYPLQSVSVMLLSDALFVLLAVLLLLFAARFLSRGRAHQYAVCCGLAAFVCLQRYLGGVFVLAGAALVVFVMRGPGTGRRLLRAVGLVAAGAVPVGGWLVRNLAVTGTLTGGRTPAAGSMLQHLLAGLTVVNDWFLPRVRAEWLGWVLLVGSAGAVVGLAVLAWRGRRADPPDGAMLVRTAAVFAASYLAAVVVATTVFVSDPIGDRLLAPAYIPVLLLVLAGLERLGHILGRGRGRAWIPRFAVPAVVLLMLVQPLYWGTKIVRSWVANGVGEYTRPVWQESATAAWLRETPPPGRLLSNDPAAVYLLTGLKVEGSPRIDEEPGDRMGTGDYLAWFARSHRPFRRPAEELDRRFLLEPVAVLEDGAVLQVLGPRGP